MDKATYFSVSLEKGHALHVLKEHKDGTVDLGTENGPVVVGKCPVSEEPKLGHCVIQKVAPKETAKGKDGAPKETAKAKPE